MANEMPPSDSFTGLSRKVIEYSEAFQGIIEAQRYPEDYDGILSGAPAVNQPSLIVSTYWPQFVMNRMGVYPHVCEMVLMTQFAVEACDEIDGVQEFDPLTGEKTADLREITVYANSHYITPRPTLAQAVKDIKIELKERLEQLHAEGKLLEAQRLEQRTTFDIEMMETTGSCKGIENYSRYLSGRRPGDPPPTLF